MNEREKSRQGRYHLLAIFLIPGLLVSIFLSGSWVIPLIYITTAVIITYLVLKAW